MNNLSWQTHEYTHIPKTKDWYWTVGIITAALVVTCLIFGNVLFALVLVIAVFALTLFSVRPPNMIEVELGDKGIRVDKILYPYPSLEAFGLDEAHRHGPRLLLKSKKVVVPLITIPIEHYSADEVHGFLKEKLHEEAFNQGILHSLLERFGF